MSGNLHVQFEEGEGYGQLSMVCSLRHRRGNPDTRFAATYPYAVPSLLYPQTVLLRSKPRRGTRTSPPRGGTSPLAASIKRGFWKDRPRQGVSLCRRAGLSAVLGVGASNERGQRTKKGGRYGGTWVPYRKEGETRLPGSTVELRSPALPAWGFPYRKSVDQGAGGSLRENL